MVDDVCTGVYGDMVDDVCTGAYGDMVDASKWYTDIKNTACAEFHLSDKLNGTYCKNARMLPNRSR